MSPKLNQIKRWSLLGISGLCLLLLNQNATWLNKKDAPPSSVSMAWPPPTAEMQMLIGSSYCVDDYGGSITPGQPMDIWNCYLGDSHETFAFYSQANGTYKLVPQNSASQTDSPLCLDVGSNGSSVVQNLCSNTAQTQLWVLMLNTDGSYSLENKQNALFISVPGANSGDGTPVTLASSSQSSQVIKFSLSSPVENIVTINPSTNPSYCFDIEQGSDAPDFGVDLYSCNWPHETFALIGLKNGAYIVSPQNNSSTPLCLDVAGLSQGNQIQIVQNPCSGSLTQQFLVVSNQDGTLSLLTLDRHYSLGIPAGNISNDTPVLALTNDGTPQSKLLINGFQPQTLQLMSALSQTNPYCLDIYGGSKSPGYGVDIYSCDEGDPHETFGFYLLNNGEYNLVSQGTASNLCLDANGNSTPYGVQVVQNPCTSGASSQEWNLVSLSSGSFSLFTSDGSFSMQVANSKLIDQNPVVLGSTQSLTAANAFFINGFHPISFNGGDGQYVIGGSGYNVNPIFPNLVSIVPAHQTGPNGEAMAVDIYEGSIQPGFGVDLWGQDSGDPHEEFIFNYNNNGTYTIYTDNGAKLCLDSINGVNNQIVQNPCDGRSTEQFKLVNNPDNTSSLISANNNLALAVQTASSTIQYGTPLIAMPNQGAPQSEFNLQGFIPGLVNPLANVPSGTMIHFMMNSDQSKIYPGATLSGSYNRDVYVYVPAEYVSGGSAPFMVVQDADYMNRLPEAIDYLVYHKRLPAMALIFAQNGLDNAQNPNAGFGVGGKDQGTERNWEYDTMSSNYPTWVNSELLPAVINQARQQGLNLNLTSDPTGRGAIGCSSGGTASFNMAWFQNSSFTRVIAFSGSFTALECLLPYGAPPYSCSPDSSYPYGAASLYANRIIQNTSMQNMRVWMSAGSNDLDWSNYGPYLKWSVAEPAMANALAQKGYHYHLDMAQGTGHCDPQVSDQTLPNALEWVWRGYGQ